MQEIISQTRAHAYVYHGDWIADCPRDGCNNAEYLFRSTTPGGPRVRRVDFYSCSHCGMEAFINWPPNMLELSQALMQRPVPDTRNWYPRDHPIAVRFNVPHGQTVADLLAEQEENEGH